MERHLQITADGSHTISVPDKSLTYHSKHGAIGESNHVFIQAGLKYYIELNPDKPITLLEMGLGTGLNCLLTAVYAKEQKINTRYHAIEAYPIPADEAVTLNYGALLAEQKMFTDIHRSAWNKTTTIHPFFELHKYPLSLQDFSGTELFNVIFYDAFAPSAQPELWTSSIFLQLYALLKPNGFLVTYCSKTVVRRAMEAAGFRVTKIPGPFGKREMVRAFKDA